MTPHIDDGNGNVDLFAEIARLAEDLDLTSLSS